MYREQLGFCATLIVGSGDDANTKSGNMNEPITIRLIIDPSRISTAIELTHLDTGYDRECLPSPPKNTLMRLYGPQRRRAWQVVDWR